MRSNKIRIIGGEWRGRRLEVMDQPGLRPTLDRVRETLFNWLQTSIHGSHCLDAFAGSGALGFEALSRGAASCVMLEASRKLSNKLQTQADKLQAQQAEILCTKAESYLNKTGTPFDIIFLDPPFEQNLLPVLFELLQKNNWLRQGTQLYIEVASKTGLSELPHNWDLQHCKRAGDVEYALALVE